MKKINLSKNKKTIVDDKDYIFLKKFKWHTYHEKKNETYYARRMERDSNHRRVPCFLHWIVKGHPLKGYVIDHVNGNTLDNRRENLRIVSHSANMRNTYKHRAGKLMGTSYHKKSKKWQAFICLGKKQKCLGFYNTEKEAHAQYKKFSEHHV